MKKYIKSIIALTLVCAVMAVILACVNSVTAPIIAEREAAAAESAKQEVLPDGEGFEAVDISKYQLPETVKGVYKASNGGYVVELVTKGYGAGMTIMCGIDTTGTVVGAKCLTSKETLEVEKTFGEKTIGKTSDTIDSVEIVAGATLTSNGYKNAIKDALNAVKILDGGAVDIHGDEQALFNGLKAALPEAEGDFRQVFISEILENDATIYVASNNAGYVFIVNGEFITTDINGEVLTKNPSVDISSDAQIIIHSHEEEIDLTSIALPSQIKTAYKTSSGNYVFDLEAMGYSETPIEIRVSATADGQIIYCQTIAQNETEGFGEKCADAEYYSQYNGKTEETISEVTAISGATQTSDAYSNAVKTVFDAIVLLEMEG